MVGQKKTCNTRHSLVVTDPTTTRALTGLAIGERTGPGVFSWLWSHVLVCYLQEPMFIITLNIWFSYMSSPYSPCQAVNTTKADKLVTIYFIRPDRI